MASRITKSRTGKPEWSKVGLSQAVLDEATRGKTEQGKAE